MSDSEIPSEGITVKHNRTLPKDLPQVIHLSSSHAFTRDILKAAQNKDKLNLRLGPQPSLDVGKKQIELHHGSTDFQRELFTGPLDGSGPVIYSGNLSHCLEIQQAKEALAGAEQALATLKNNLKAVQEERSEGGPLGKLKRDHKSSSLFSKERRLPGSTPSSPFLGAGLSPRNGPTSAPLLGGLSPQEKIKQEAIKIPMMHLLAIEPISAKDLATKLRIGQADCDKVLSKVAQEARSGGGKKELRDRSYKDLDVWKFKYQSQHDRQSAIDHAVSAFDRQRIDKADKLWQMLLAPEDRGKGIFLSRLNFDKPLPSGNLTPRIPERSTDGSTEGKSMTSEGDGQNKKVRSTNQLVNDMLNKKKRAQPEPVEKKAPAPKPAPKVTKEREIPVIRNPKKTVETKSVKQDSKFKSSERIEDSDEEAEAAQIVVLQPAGPSATSRKTETTSQKTTLPAKPPVSVPATKKSANTAHKPSTSSSSSSSVEIDNRLAASRMAKTRAGTDTSKSKTSPRPRTGSSPQKPSPLGSSPPANSTDVDASSSGKASSRSSAPSSPPSSNESNEIRRDKKYSPVITDRKAEKQPNGIQKRKAEPSNDEPHPKRKQANGVHVNGLPKALNDQVEDSKKHRPSPESDSISSPEKPQFSRQSVIDDAREFLRCYTKYKNLHESLGRTKAADRTDHDVNKLWKMHERLKEMKEQIWQDWEYLERRNGR